MSNVLKPSFDFLNSGPRKGNSVVTVVGPDVDLSVSRGNKVGVLQTVSLHHLGNKATKDYSESNLRKWWFHRRRGNHRQPVQKTVSLKKPTLSIRKVRRKHTVNVVSETPSPHSISSSTTPQSPLDEYIVNPPSVAKNSLDLSKQHKHQCVLFFL